MKRRVNFDFHPNLKVILDAVGRSYLFPKFENLRHRIYELVYLTDVIYPFILKDFNEEVKKYEKDLSDIMDGKKPIFYI